MDRATALTRLPEPYAAALRLHDRGLDDDQIADQLGIDPAGIPALVRLADAKLARVLDPETGTR